MIAVCVDDEKLQLDALKRAVEKSPDIQAVYAFDDGAEALAWCREHRVDIAFLDIELHKINGLDLARELISLWPRLAVVFCTGYERYALPALRMHRDVSYLLKPFRVSQVQAEIDYFKYRVERRKKLRAVTFGSFEVYADKTPLVFRRTKTKELLAYMIDRRGAETSVNTLCAVLWPDETDDERKRDYLYHLFSDLKKTLKDAGFPDAVLSRGRGYAVDTQKIDCDYYHLLDGDARARRSFVGEYMDQYSWSEPTCAWLTERYVSGR